MNERAQDLRRKAITCEELADSATNLRTAQEYLELARQWEKLALQVERCEILSSRHGAPKLVQR
jgi:hypothetical protein